MNQVSQDDDPRWSCHKRRCSSHPHCYNPLGKGSQPILQKDAALEMKSPRGGYCEQHCIEETKEDTKSLPRIPFPVQPRHSQGNSDAFPQSEYYRAQNQSNTVQRNSLQWETLKSWYSYRDIQPGFARTISYKLSMCLLWKENMFFPAHHNLIPYHQPLFSETVIWIHYPFRGYIF